MPATRIARLTRRYTFDGRVVEPLALVPLAAIAVFAAIMALGVRSGLFTYRGDELNDIFPLMAVVWLCGLACQAIHLQRAGEALKITGIAGLLTMTASLATAVLARISAPLADDVLARMDKAIFFGLEWRDAIPALARHRPIAIALSHAYASLEWQPTVLTVYFCLTARWRRAWQVLAVMAITLVCCLAVFPFCPALGGYIHFGIPRAAVPDVLVPSAWKAPATLIELKDGRLDYLGLKTMSGIVTMPSFHAASAVILLWGFWASRTLRWPLAALNVAMLVSTVPIGGHYLVDVPAGALAALLAIQAVRLVSRRIDHGRSRSATEARGRPALSPTPG